MLGGILFVIFVWFVPLILWLLIQNPFKKKASCEANKREIARDKRMFFIALASGVLILLAIILFG